MLYTRSDPALRDYYGAVRHFLEFEAPAAGERHPLRFGVAVHGSDTFLNGRHVGAGGI